MKNKFLIITAIAATSLCLMGGVAQAVIQSSNADLYSSTLDFENEKMNVEKVSVKKALQSAYGEAQLPCCSRCGQASSCRLHPCNEWTIFLPARP